MLLTIILKPMLILKLLKLPFYQDNGAKQFNFYNTKAMKKPDLTTSKLPNIIMM